MPVKTMRALTIQDGKLVIDERPVPEPVGNQVLVRVHGAGLNRADLFQRLGAYPAPPGVPPDIPGLEFAGEVAAVGNAVHALHAGDAVFGIVGGGAQAEYVLTEDWHCARVPPNLDLVAAGGVPEAFITAHDALMTQAELHPGERVLITAVGSGVGTAALQIAESLGAIVVGTARTPDKLERCRALGLAGGVCLPGELDGAAEQIVAAAGGPIDVVVDLVGGAYVEVGIRAVATKARIIVVGTLAGMTAQLDLLTLMGKRAVIRGTMLRNRPAEEKAAATHAFAGQVGPWLAAGTIRPVIDSVLPLEQAEVAYELLAADATFGKVVLSLL